MTSVDLESAAAVPLPLSPTADEFKPLSFPQAGPESESARRESLEQGDAQSEDEPQHQEKSNGHAVNGAEDTAAEVVEQVVNPPADVPPSQEDTTAHGEQSAVPVPQPHEPPQESSADAEDVPPALPIKMPVTAETFSPPPRRDSLTPSTAVNGRALPSVDTRRANGHVLAQNTPTRPDSSSSHRRSLTISKGHTVSAVLISSALETIAASKDAKRSTQLRESVQRALEMVKVGEGGDRPREIFEPLRIACETNNEKLVVASLDCISKLISYSFFAETSPPSAQGLPSPPPSPGPTSRHSTSSNAHPNIAGPTLVDLVVHTITSCHSESTPDTVSLQIVKALLSLVLSPTIFVHQSSLLKAVRTVYNIFLLSTDPINQTVAQGGLTQMVNHVFARCKLEGPSLSRSDSMATLSSARASPRRSSMRKSFRPSSPLSVQRPLSPPTTADQASITGTMETGTTLVETPASETTDLPPEEQTNGVSSDHLEEHPESMRSEIVLDDEPQAGHELTTNDLFIKDAFLVFRALCKLTMKPLNPESERDPKSHAMRSKLLSLHLVLIILNNHMSLLVSPRAVIYSSSTHDATTFIQAITQYLCLALSRNAVSPVAQVFEISVEIFWRVIAGMRTKLKKEIEVLLHEIFIPILEMKTSSIKQKAVIMAMLQRLCQDPQALVEIYLNYDCDSEAADNIYEHLINIVSKLGSAPITHTPPKNAEPTSPAQASGSRQHGTSSTAPPLSTSALSVPGSLDTSGLGLSEPQLRRQSLECLVAVLKSLVAWGTTTTNSGPADSPGDNRSSAPPPEDLNREDTVTPDPSLDRLNPPSSATDTSRQATPDPLADDPSRFESAKQRKTTLLEGIKKFNFKPKRGIKFFLESGFIPSPAPQDIARFLLDTDGLSKAMIGEYLGEGDDENIAIMHAFVDLMEFEGLPFVDALRTFLQSFRLPGEAQKIDRYMLKFAERYIGGNPNTDFANADTAYVLAYSTILLNTDAHNPQVKNRMTKADFIKNNRGINDGHDLPEALLESIYDEIVNNEIRMKDEVEAAPIPIAPAPGIANALVNVGRDRQREAYLLQSNNMAAKTELMFRSLIRTQRKGSKNGDQFFSASHFVHVKPMFEVAWIPFLAGLSGPLQETDDLEIVELCLDGFKSAIRIVCFFDLELERNAFVTTLAKFTFLNNLGEMKTKNMEAIKALLDVAITEGNSLKDSWREVLTCVSQLEHMQLISSGVDVPEVKKGRPRKLPTEELANESRSTHITVAADMVFSSSHYLSGTAIVDFVRALCDVSWEEIQSSGMSQHPRLFSLQKLVCCHNNPHVAFFALDDLRQLAMRFLEKEELPHFKFQKDFLRPFEYTMVHNSNPDVRDLVLQCLQQMIQARANNLRSGWRTMFGVFSSASKVSTERIVSSAFEIVTHLNEKHFASIVRHGSFADLTVCITDFCKVNKYQKISLLAIAMLRGVIPVMLESPECGFKAPAGGGPAHADDPMIKYWFPTLFGFYDVIMNGEDLEVRGLALDSLFSTLTTHGSTFPLDFWDTVCQELLFPIFAVLKSSQDLSRFSTQEDMSVWLSTTMIEALRKFIDLYSVYFQTLQKFWDSILDLLCVCICQENDTLARIGTSCLQQLLEKNVSQLDAVRWDRVARTFVNLFKTTTPYQLFDENLRVEIDGTSSDAQDAPGMGYFILVFPALTGSAEPNGQPIVPAPLSTTTEPPKLNRKISISERRRIFKQIIVKCVLQLLLIETTNELFRKEEIYKTIPPEHLLKLSGVLDQSYRFARDFNEDKELRTGLWKVGFMKHLPNLLKQESSSAATSVHILLRVYFDPRPAHQAAKQEVLKRLLPLGLGVLKDFIKLRGDTQAKNIAAWTPVVGEIMQGFVRFEDIEFTSYLPAIYPLTTELLARDMAPEIRLALRDFYKRVGQVQGIIEDL
ncbi:hypothetical protein NM688_g6554 [Phlebia brevispora]|uniref:Uncharacterized protein n=1 Tax=Phlebia brevispora TaxID=194682 RepID=A0ACC1SES1_9APHY|nr:hypothetical protein NM688_g6554 [Phlebia brevispora]